MRIIEPTSHKSQPAFSAEEYADRLQKLNLLLNDKRIDLYIASAPESLNYFTGFDPLGLYLYQHAFYKADSREPTLLTHKAEKELARVQCWISDVMIWQHGDDPVEMTIRQLRRMGVKQRVRVGVELGNWYLKASTFQALTEAFPGVHFVDVTEGVLKLRAVKSFQEIEYMREAARFSDVGFQAVVDSLKPGARENDILAAVQSSMAKAGSEYPTLPFIIASGPRAGHFHAVPTSRVVELNDPVSAEVTGSWKRYNSNICRTLVAGRASAEMLELWKIVNEAFWRPFELIRPGAAVADVDHLSRKIRAAYQNFIPARAGFGMGLAYPPTFAALPNILMDSEEILEAGMIFSLEPSIAQYNGLTISIGYNILVTSSGAEILQKTSNNIFEVPA
ncbi:M24 family metallopeptidase [Sinorhizobium mexicanum]|nr:Xaa-Pro peptidase family protein [Sinorhizobium mexicanum]MBP1885146.1 Xaa-Pro dipeptidase [Sinorhizobium mexicanum]